MSDGGPAFPGRVIGDMGREYPVVGMSLRDWFAGQAAASLAQIAYMSGHRETAVDIAADIAADAYQLADALLKTRE